jgi:hypothetical protein
MAREMSSKIEAAVSQYFLMQEDTSKVPPKNNHSVSEKV